MLDQASRLREMAAAYRAQAAGSSWRRTKALAVTSGKGGVGKTNMSTNLAHVLMDAKKDVILFDADVGMANADILLGTVPPHHVGHLLDGSRGIMELVHRTRTGLKLIAGGSGLTELANLSRYQIELFLTALTKLEGQTDYLIVDTGAGIGSAVQEFVLAADEILVVTTPEPTALADAYTAIKAVGKRNPQATIKLIVNQAERTEEADAAAERIIVTAYDFLGLQVTHLGTVPRDPHVWHAVRQQVPFVLAYPGAPASRAVTAIGRKLLGEKPQEPTGGFFDRLAGLFGRKGNVVG